MADNFARDFNDKDLGVGTLSPGSTPRRYEPEGGINKHNERIHRESAAADVKNLPFSFSKPLKPRRQKTVVCNDCGTHYRLNVNSVGVVCTTCHKFCGILDAEE